MLNTYELSAISAILISFLVTVILGKFMIPFLHKLKYGQTILEIGPSWHKNKQGTPTMGGIIMIITMILVVTGAYVFLSLNGQMIHG